MDAMGFQSTLPMRGATKVLLYFFWLHMDFNPRSPCGERRPTVDKKRKILVISIHAPHAGSDNTLKNSVYQQIISIHAPHAGSDGISTAP